MISRAARDLCIAAVLCAVCAFGAQLLMEVDAQREDAAGPSIGLGILMLLVTPMPWIVGSAAFVVSAEALARSAGGALGAVLRAVAWLGIALAVAASAATLLLTPVDLAYSYAEAQAHSPISVALSFLALGCVLLSLVLMAIIVLGPAWRPDAMDRLEAGEVHEHAPLQEGRR